MRKHKLPMIIWALEYRSIVIRPAKLLLCRVFNQDKLASICSKRLNIILKALRLLMSCVGSKDKRTLLYAHECGIIKRLICSIKVNALTSTIQLHSSKIKLLLNNVRHITCNVTACKGDVRCRPHNLLHAEFTL